MLTYSKSIFVPKTKEELYKKVFEQGSDKVIVTYTLPKFVDNIESKKQKSSKYLPNKHLETCQTKQGQIVEAEVVKCKNGIAVNFCQDYMRKRDPNSMYIADNLPTDKPKFKDAFGQEFDKLRQDTLSWLKSQDLVILPFLTGGMDGYPSLLVAPKNASFFAYAMSELQHFVSLYEYTKTFCPQVVIFVAPPFRHTHFDGKQIVVHNRTDIYELFSYNLYPGPSAKKGLYGFLLENGKKENYLVAHASCIKVITPYENELVIMHEGASGGGKTEMCEQIHRERDGKILIAKNLHTQESIYMLISETSDLLLVGDDMLKCTTNVDSKKLTVKDAECGWFLRVDNIKCYGSEPLIERLSIHPESPLCFFNIESSPNTTCLIWEHSLDNDNNANQNPRLIMPRKNIPGTLTKPVEVDIRSFGIRTPPCTKQIPSYGIIGMLHILPPALAFVWRLIAPRGYNNPSIMGDNRLVSEGVGSFWPFASGKYIDYANILLEQIIETPNTLYVLIPNQNIGCYEVGFATQWISREYLARHGTSFSKEHLRPSRLPLLGYELEHLKINGQYMRNELLHPYEQIELGLESYDNGAKILMDFVKKELEKYNKPQLNNFGKQIIESVQNDGKLEDYIKLL